MSLWETGQDLEAAKFNKSFNTGLYQDVTDSTELPTTMGEGILQYDKKRISVSTDGESFDIKLGIFVDTPASATATGVPGQMASDASGNFYLCIAEDTWVRTLLATW
jgi:hypothetical protein